MLRFITDKFRTSRTEPPDGLRGTRTASPARPFSPDLQVWVEDGVRFGLATAGFWAECRRGAELLSLTCVSESLRDELSDAKVLGMLHGALFAVAADCCVDGDIIDEFTDGRRPAGCDRVVIKDGFIPVPKSQQLRDEVPSEGPAGGAEKKRIADFAAAIRNEYDDRVRRLPRRAEFSGMLRYDRRRYFDTIRNAHRLAGGEAGRLRRQFDPLFAAADHLLVSATMDAMGSPEIDPLEIVPLREAIWRAQYQFRKQDLATAWEAGSRPAEADSIRDSTHPTTDGFSRCRRELLLAQPILKSVDLGRLVAGLDELAGRPIGDEDTYRIPQDGHR